jgi:hypothetical protein
VLLVVGAETAIVGAAPLHGCVVNVGHFRTLDEDFAAAAVIIDVIGDENMLGAVFGTTLE